MVYKSFGGAEMIPVDDCELKNYQLVVVAAWEFGQEPRFYICRFWQSTLPGQPKKFYLDQTYNAAPSMEVGNVRYVIPLPENLEALK
jgi:hypothetical protein